MKTEDDKALLDHNKMTKLIKAFGLKQEEFAEELGISDRYVRTITSKNKNISISLANSISKTFDCSIESLLTVSKTTQYEKQDIGLYSINQIIRDSILNYLTQFTDRRIKIKTRLTPNLPHILLNRPYIKQVIINCLRNSYASVLTKNQPDKRIFICTRLASNQQMVEILILDNGIGITPENQANFFKPSNVTKLRNNSINASISMAIIKQHGGNMTISGKFGKGCRIYIELPVHNK